MSDTLTLPAVIDRFEGEWKFLSNFVLAPWVELDGVSYPTVEHAYQAAKVADPAVRVVMQRAGTAGVAKKLGRHVRPRDGWELMKVGVMHQLLLQKFSVGRSPDYLAGLLRTGDAVLIEGNDWRDEEWGCVIGEDGWWRGKNLLGKLLMAVRDQRRSER